MKTIVPALRLLLVLSALTGIAYPTAITLVAQRLWPSKCEGSIIYRDGRPIGSMLLGQEVTEPDCFWPRPSATRPAPYTGYDAATGGGSGGSNLGPTNRALARSVRARVAALREAERRAGLMSTREQAPPRVPTELVTCSASGLDPEITRTAALYQAPRVARARGLEVSAVVLLVRSRSRAPLLGLFGEWRVNVLELNMALEELTRIDGRP